VSKGADKRLLRTYADTTLVSTTERENKVCVLQSESIDSQNLFTYQTLNTDVLDPTEGTLEVFQN
jgi:hypothetical protein